MTFAAKLSLFIKRYRLRRELEHARAEVRAAVAGFVDADKRNDDRDRGRFRDAIGRAQVRRLRAENALYKPKPLPRPVQASKARSAGA